jgi:hypothetical protein
VTIEDWAARLGFTPEVRAWFDQASSEEARAALDALKIDAKRLYRQYARQLHPDLGGDEEQLKLLNAARDMIERLSLSIAEPIPEEPPAPRVVTVSGNWVRL